MIIYQVWVTRTRSKTFIKSSQQYSHNRKKIKMIHMIPLKWIHPEENKNKIGKTWRDSRKTLITNISKVRIKITNNIWCLSHTCSQSLLIQIYSRFVWFSSNNSFRLLIAELKTMINFRGTRGKKLMIIGLASYLFLVMRTPPSINTVLIKITTIYNIKLMIKKTLMKIWELMLILLKE